MAERRGKKEKRKIKKKKEKYVIWSKVLINVIGILKKVRERMRQRKCLKKMSQKLYRINDKYPTINSRRDTCFK